MAIKSEIKSLSDVESYYHDLYKKEGEVYKLKDPELAKVFSSEKEKNIDAGKRIQSLIKLAEDQKKEIDELKKAGDSKKKTEPSEIKKDEPDTNPIKTGKKDVDKEIQERFKKMKEQNEALEKRMKDLQDRSQQEKDTAELKELVLNKGGNWDILKPHVLKSIKREKDTATGKEVLKVLDPEGNPRWDGSELFTPEKYIEELKNSKSFKAVFNAKKEGSGINEASKETNVDETDVTKGSLKELQGKLQELKKNDLLPTHLPRDFVKSRVKEIEESLDNNKSLD